jgi:uncharacterized membrane protein YagU involved in acid resistance
MPDLPTRAAAGAVGGFVATGPMTIAMWAIRAALPCEEQYPIPPRIVTRRAAAAADVAHRLDEPEMKAATTVAHFGFGAAAGAVYGAVVPRLPFGPAANGIAFGLGVWAGSYLGWLPAVGLHPPAHRESLGRNLVHFGAHVVWGSVLGLLTAQLLDGRSPGRTSAVSAPRPEVLAGG